MAEKRTFGRRERRASPSVSWTRSRADRRRSRCIDGAIGDPCPTCATARCRANENVLDKFREGPAVAVSMPSRCRTQGRRLHRQPDNFDDLPTCRPASVARIPADRSASAAIVRNVRRRNAGAFQDRISCILFAIFATKRQGALPSFSQTRFFREPRRPGLDSAHGNTYLFRTSPKGMAERGLQGSFG